MIAEPALELLHRPVAALVRTYGVPLSVSTRDDGQRFVFGDASSTVTAVVDDDAMVHALDVSFPSGTVYPISIGGAVHRFTFGSTTSLAARDELAADAETTGTNFRVFRLGPETELVLLFDPSAMTLTRVVAGDRGALLRLGYVTDQQPLQRRFPFAAPVLRRSDVSDGSGAKATVLRLDLDRAGSVKQVTVVIPSDDDAFDRGAAAKLVHDAYRPATLGGRAIGATVFREVRH